MRIDSRMSIEIDPSELNEVINYFKNLPKQSYITIEKKVNEIKNNKIEQQIREARSKIKNWYDCDKYDEVVNKLRKDRYLFEFLQSIVRDKELKEEVQLAVETQKISIRLKDIIQTIVIKLLDLPEFVTINLGRPTEKSKDKGSNILWGYLHMILTQFMKQLKYEIGCIEMSSMIHGLLMDLLGDASHK